MFFRFKYEEDVEEGGDRWSKPHVATLSLYSLFEVRSCLMSGTVFLDMEADSLSQIAGEENILYLYPHSTVCILIFEGTQLLGDFAQNYQNFAFIF